jgi:hypothetical protein
VYQKLHAAHISVSFPFPLFGKKVGVPRTLESAMLVTKCVRDVQELKTHASESGQMHAQHLAIFFCCKGTVQYVRVRSKMAFFRTEQAAATFSLSMHQYGRSFLLSYIEIMAACIFTRSFVWRSSDDRNLSILFPPHTIGVRTIGKLPRSKWLFSFFLKMAS